MSVATELVEELVILIRSMLPPRSTIAPPVKVIVSSFSGGKGTALVGKTTISLLAHPGQELSQGDTVVAVPLDSTFYYVVGRV